MAKILKPVIHQKPWFYLGMLVLVAAIYLLVRSFLDSSWVSGTAWRYMIAPPLIFVAYAIWDERLNNQEFTPVMKILYWIVKISAYLLLAVFINFLLAGFVLSGMEWRD